ncbi:MAG: ATP-dependent Clp protease ATP-binding subunit ClpX, partial [Chlamydiota bacterium]
SLSSAKMHEMHDKNHLLSLVEPVDLVQFGMIPEFVGRFNALANCNELRVEDLVTILTQPKNAVVKQYTHMFAEENVKLSFTPEALQAIAQKAIDAGTGARALRMILEDLLRDWMYDLPSRTDVVEVLVEEDTILHKRAPLIKTLDDKKIA